MRMRNATHQYDMVVLTSEKSEAGKKILSLDRLAGLRIRVESKSRPTRQQQCFLCQEFEHVPVNREGGLCVLRRRTLVQGVSAAQGLRQGGEVPELQGRLPRFLEVAPQPHAAGDAKSKTGEGEEGEGRRSPFEHDVRECRG